MDRSEAAEARSDWRAAVAIVVRQGSAGDEILLIRRATVEGDPWSGHIALPGGRYEPEDESLEATARRETLEETGLDLCGSECVRQLTIVAPRMLRAPGVSVAPFVFRYYGHTDITMSEEVVEAWWLPVSELQTAESWRTVPVTVHGGATVQARGFSIGEYVLWGLTERILDEFLRSWGDV